MATAAYRAPLEDTPEDQERDALRAMLDSAGWRIFAEHVAETWADGRVLDRMGGAAIAIDDPAHLGLDTARHLAGRVAVQAVMEWPLRRVTGRVLRGPRKAARC